MRSSYLSFISYVLMAFLPAGGAVAQSAPSAVEAPKYHMALVSFYKADPREQSIAVFFPDHSGGYVFKSVDLLKEFIATLPQNSTLEWTPSDTRIGGELILSSAKGLEDFRAYCRQKGVNLIMVPGG